MNIAIHESARIQFSYRIYRTTIAALDEFS